MYGMTRISHRIIQILQKKRPNINITISDRKSHRTMRCRKVLTEKFRTEMPEIEIEEKRKTGLEKRLL